MKEKIPMYVHLGSRFIGCDIRIIHTVNCAFFTVMHTLVKNTLAASKIQKVSPGTGKIQKIPINGRLPPSYDYVYISPCEGENVAVCAASQGPMYRMFPCK